MAHIPTNGRFSNGSSLRDIILWHMANENVGAVDIEGQLGQDIYAVVDGTIILKNSGCDGFSLACGFGTNGMVLKGDDGFYY